MISFTSGGTHINGSLGRPGIVGYYWSSLYNNFGSALDVNFNSDHINWFNDARPDGFLVHPVANPKPW